MYIDTDIYICLYIYRYICDGAVLREAQAFLFMYVRYVYRYIYRYIYRYTGDGAALREAQALLATMGGVHPVIKVPIYVNRYIYIDVYRYIGDIKVPMCVYMYMYRRSAQGQPRYI